MPQFKRVDEQGQPVSTGFKRVNESGQPAALAHDISWSGSAGHRPATPDPDTGVIAAVKRTASNIAGLPATLFRASVPTSREDVETLLRGGPAGLLTQRLWADPLKARMATENARIAEMRSSTEPKSFSHGFRDLGNLAVSGVKTAASAVPGIGPLAVDIAERGVEKGDVSGALTEAALNAALPKVVPAAARVIGKGGSLAAELGQGAANTLAERLYESALKPGPRTNTLPEVSRMVKTGLREGVSLSGRGGRKLNRTVGELNNEIKAVIDAGNAAGVTISPAKAAQAVNAVAAKFKMQATPRSDLAAIGGAKKEFLTEHSRPIRLPSGQTIRQEIPIPASKAQAIKQGTYQRLGEKAYGEVGTARVEAEKGIARGLKDELAQAFPEIKDLNLREGDLLDLKPELEAALNRGRNRELFGIGTPIFGGAVGTATSSAPAGFAAGALRSLLDRPGVKSRLAIALSRIGGR